MLYKSKLIETIIVSADGDSIVYLVPGDVADNLSIHG